MFSPPLQKTRRRADKKRRRDRLTRSRLSFDALESRNLLATLGEFSLPVDSPEEMAAEPVGLSRAPAWAALSVVEADGGELPVNTTVNDYQEQPSVAVRADDSYVVVWSNYDGGGGIYAKIYNADDTVARDEFLISNITDGIQVRPDVAVDPTTGQFVVAWQNDSLPMDMMPGQSDIYARAFASDGTPMGDQVLVSDGTGDHYDPTIAFATSGDFVVAWDSFNTQSQIFARRFTSANAVDGATFEVSNAAGGIFPDIAAAADGSYAIAFESVDGAGRGALVRRFGADDTPAGDPVIVNSTTTGDQTTPVITMRSDGSFVVAWISQDATATQLFAQQYDSNGDPVGGELRVDQNDIVVPLAPAITSLVSGRFLVTWTEDDQSTSAREVIAREFMADGTPEDDSFTVPTNSTGDQQNPDVAFAGTTLISVWDGDGAAGDFLDIFARTFEVNPNQPPAVALQNTLTTLAENTTVQTKVADIVVSDDDTGDETLGLSGSDADLFEILGSELFLKAGQTVDFETNPQLDVGVTVDDPTVGTTPDDEATLSIAVSDVNEPPTIALSSTVTSLPEGATAQTKVADIVVTDDALGDETLSLIGADATMFEIIGSELFLRAGQTLDFDTQIQLDVGVSVDDSTVGTTPDDEASLSIAVTDVNQPPSITLQNVVTTLPEDTTAKTRVADVVVMDDALGSETLGLTGDDADLFEIEGTELFLKAGQTLSSEGNAQLDVTVSVDDVTVGSMQEDKD